MTLGEIIKRNARRFPNDLALVFKDNCFTFAEFNQRTNCLANGLIDNGARIKGGCSQGVRFIFRRDKRGAENAWQQGNTFRFWYLQKSLSENP